MNNCIASDNSAPFGGGGIFVETSMLNLLSSKFLSHNSEAGAVVYSINSIIETWNCHYTGNGAHSLSSTMTYQGGVMYLSSSSSLESHYCSFDNNAVSFLLIINLGWSCKLIMLNLGCVWWVLGHGRQFRALGCRLVF